MASQEDYANVLLALTTLAQAPVAAYPESGPYQMAKDGQNRAVGKLADEAAKKAQKKAKKKGLVNNIATGVGTLGGALVGGPVGAAVGGSLGNMFTGGTVDAASLATSFAESKMGSEGAVAQNPLTKRVSQKRVSSTLPSGVDPSNKWGW